MLNSLDISMTGVGSVAINHEVRESIEPKLTTFGMATLKDRYLLPGESCDGMVERVAKAYSDDDAHCARMVGYIKKLWFMPATPILSNGGTDRGLSISCFVNECGDSLKEIIELWTENAWLASKGGGIGTHWGDVRSIGEKLSKSGETSGVIPFIRVSDSMALAISQGSLRRGSAAVYLDVSHPEIEEFVEIRRHTGGDFNRKSLNLHNAVCITDAFMQAVIDNAEWDLKSPKTGAIISKVSARALWIRMLNARIELGEPYILFVDTVNESIPEHHKKLGLRVRTSNLCSEITLPTGIDHLGKKRTAVCCLSSLNLTFFDEWKDNEQIIEDALRFLDNVLQSMIDKAPKQMADAIYSAERERSVGLGAMGFASYLQSKMIPFESATAQAANLKIFSHIKKKADEASKKIAQERGPCLDAKDCGVMERFSNKTTIAPTASISIIAGECSPGIEPCVANVYVQKTLSGSFVVANKYLIKLLQDKGIYDEEVLSSISSHEGSVAHLKELSSFEKDVFKTAYEIDQAWIIDHAADRAKFIDQSQSVNIFFKGNTTKKYLHMMHYRAWKKKLKSLYYCRSMAVSRADKISHSQNLEDSQIMDNYDECLSCQ